MITGAQQTSTQATPDSEDGQGTPAATPYAAPSISAPRGGGAIRGIGEKFAANPVTGTGSMTVPVPTSPGSVRLRPRAVALLRLRSGKRRLRLGWSLSLPNVDAQDGQGPAAVLGRRGIGRLRTVRRRGPRSRPRAARAGSHRRHQDIPDPALPAARRRTLRPHRALDGHGLGRDPLALDHARQRHDACTATATTPGSPSPAPRTHSGSSAG